MPSPRHWSWWKRHETLLIGLALGVLVAALAGYNVYVLRVSHRNDRTAVVATRTQKKVTHLSASQCAQARFTFEFFNALAQDSSSHFGSPPDGAIVPGARDGLLRKLYASERVAARPLRAQGCRVDVPA